MRTKRERIWFCWGMRGLKLWNWRPGRTFRGRRCTRFWIAWWKRASHTWCRIALSYFPPWSQLWRFRLTWRAGGKSLEHELTDQARSASNLMEDLIGLYSEGRGGRGTLDFLRIVSEPTQTASEYRRMLVRSERRISGISRVPRMRWIRSMRDWCWQARLNGVSCRLLIETGNDRRAAPAAAGRIRGGGSGNPAGIVAAAEAGPVRWLAAG